MPTKQFYATGGFRYGTRRLMAGDPIELDGPNARLFLALGKVTDKPPRTRKPQLDHDQDGVAGGSPKGETSTRAKGARRKARK